MRSRFGAHWMQNRNTSPHPGSGEWRTIPSMKIKINSGFAPVLHSSYFTETLFIQFHQIATLHFST